MPRRQQKAEESKKKSKKQDDEKVEEIEDEIIDDEAMSKKNKKMTPKPKNKKHAKPETQEEEDELSDLDAVDDEAQGDQEGNDEMVHSNKPMQRPQRKAIDPKTPIGTLKTDEVLSYLIDVGHNTLNPQLKNGALDLLNQLTGRRRRQPQYNGQNRGFDGQNRGFGNRGHGRFMNRNNNNNGNNGNNGMQRNSMQPKFGQNTNGAQKNPGQGEQDIYGESD